MGFKRVSIIKKIFIIVLISFFVLAVYVEFFTNKPEDTIEKYFESINSMDYLQLIECFEPSVQRVSNGILGISSSLIGIDLEDVFSILPAIIPLAEEESLEYDVSNIHVITYQGKYINEKFQIKSEIYKKIVGAFFADEVIVEFCVCEKYSNEKEVLQMKLKKYDMQWLIPAGEEPIVIN